MPWMTVADAQAQHDMYHHMHTLAQLCVTPCRREDWARRRAALAVRDFCAAKMQATFTELASSLLEAGSEG